MKSLTVLVAAIATAWCTTFCGAAPIPSRPVHTSKQRFRIPFRYDAAELRTLGAREVRLYVSLDRGVRWQHAQSVPPTTQRFDFKAPQDGEYWFAVRTLDARSQLHPRGNVMSPGLKVVVDSTAPLLEVRLRQTAPGKVQLVWRAVDPHLDPASLRLEYIQPGISKWQQVGVVPQAQGQTAWSVPQGGRVAVRGLVKDRASNVGQAQQRIVVAPANEAVPRPPRPDFRQPIAGAEPSTISPRYPGLAAADRGSVLSSEFPRRPFSSGPSGSNSEAGGNDPIISPSRPNFPGQSGRRVSDRPETRPAPLQGRYSNPPQTAAVRRTPGRFRSVNTRRFQIGYKIDDVGPSGVGEVELFITQDDGRKWWRYGSDADRKSPFEVEVPSDGVYGFALRVKSGAGLADSPPQPGEKPSIVVAVDKTPPIVEQLHVQQGQGTALNKLIVRWKISDANPAEKPVALAYASHPNGPWEPINGWQPDTGSYVWDVGTAVSARKLYVRVTARDAAGNMTRRQTLQPIIVDLTTPSARIVDVEPNDSEATPQ